MKISMLLVLLAPASCYEGWDAENYGGPRDGEEQPSPSTKPIYYILYQPIYLNQSGINDDTCFSQTDVREFRQNEWASRSAALQKAMNELADVVVVSDLGVSADDCETLTLLWNAALSRNPWGSDAPGTDPLGRPLIHVKAVFYDGEPLTSPPAAVTREHWAAFDDLAVAGVNVRSRHYFVLANPVGSYFSEWWNALPRETSRFGTSIDAVDPTPDGIKERDRIIEADTADFSSWLIEQ